MGRMRAIVTGAAGFIGSTVVDRLLGRGHQVVGIDNLTSGNVANLRTAFAPAGGAGSFRLACMDVRSDEIYRLVADFRPDVVFHLAAQVDVRASVTDPGADADVNVLGTVNVCEAARRAGVRRIVYAASGGSRYGTPVNIPVPESAAPEPLSPYAVSKLAGEYYLGAYAGMYGMSPICLALANVFGPRQSPHGEAGVIAIFGGAMLGGRPVTIYGDGTAARDFVYVDDVARAFEQAGSAPLSASGTYNIGTGRQTTVDSVHAMIAAAVGRSTPALYAPARTGELRAIALDIGKAAAQLGWQPEVDIQDGIRRTVDWQRGLLADDAAGQTITRPIVSVG